MNVTWEEPRFKDNVKVDRVLARTRNGIDRSPTPFQVSYSAYDTSGNAAQCMFSVDFNSKLKIIPFQLVLNEPLSPRVLTF